MANTSAMDAASDVNTFLALNGSFNLYMASGPAPHTECRESLQILSQLS